MIAALRHRIVWAYALGLVLFYAPYAGLAKAVTAGLVQVTDALLQVLTQLRLVTVLGQELDVGLTGPVPLAEPLVLQCLLA